MTRQVEVINICYILAGLFLTVCEAGCHRPKVEMHLESGNLAEWSKFSTGEECTWVIYPPERYKRRKRIKLEITVKYFNMTTNKKQICRKEFTQNKDQRLCLLEGKRYNYYLPGCKKNCEKPNCKNLDQFPLKFHFTASRNSDQLIGFSFYFKFQPCIIPEFQPRTIPATRDATTTEAQTTKFINATTVHLGVLKESGNLIEILLPVVFGLLLIVGVIIIAFYIRRKRNMKKSKKQTPPSTDTGTENAAYQSATYEEIDNGDLSSFNNHSYDAVIKSSPIVRKQYSSEPTYIDIGHCVSVSQECEELNQYEQIDFPDLLDNYKASRESLRSENICPVDDKSSNNHGLKYQTNEYDQECTEATVNNTNVDSGCCENGDNVLYDEVND